MRTARETITFTVSCRNGAYVTSTVKGQRASSTHSAEVAARSLAEKIFDKGALIHSVSAEPLHQITVWRAERVYPARRVEPI